MYGLDLIIYITWNNKFNFSGEITLKKIGYSSFLSVG